MSTAAGMAAGPADAGAVAPSDADAAAVVLAVNAGSSSLKYGLYDRAGQALLRGGYERLEQGGFDAALADLLARLDALRASGRPLRAVAHRIVHGGTVCTAPCRLDAPGVLPALRALSPLAPLHQPHNLDGVDAFSRALPAVPQVGCFDTAFHASVPEAEWRLPIDRSIAHDGRGNGLRRYGFHGLSYQYVAAQIRRLAPDRADGRWVLAHLGNGASVCAVQGGRSVATSMGFSALDGLVMGTRSGSLDPGVLLHLLAQGWDAAGLERLLYKRSGLLGVSGLSADFRTLRASAAPEAAQAIALFTRRLLRELGGMAALLGGIDGIAFTGGIGEHDARLRAEALTPLGFAGVRLDDAANAAATGDAPRPIHAADSAVALWVIPTDEGRVAAQAAFALLAPPA